ncbi:MAG: DMT family transporter [Clostridia bacterium]|nr:DMT family transporter [Clostridia bacterium]
MKNKSIILIILAGILWGTSGIFVHFLAPMGLTSLQMTTIRSTVSAVCMILYALIGNREMFKIKLIPLILAFFCGIAVFFTAYSYYSSMQLTSVSTAVVLMYTSPIFIMAFSVAFMGEKLTRIKILAVLLMIAGCALVSGIIGTIKLNTMGIILGFVSSFAYGTYNIVAKFQMKRGTNPLSACMYCYIFMAIVSLFVSNPAGIAHVAIKNPSTVWLMLGCGICTCVLPYFLYTISLKYLPVGTASALSIVEPMAATFFSITILDEYPGFFSGLGIVLIIGATYLLSRVKE